MMNKINLKIVTQFLVLIHSELNIESIRNLRTTFDCSCLVPFKEISLSKKSMCINILYVIFCDISNEQPDNISGWKESDRFGDGGLYWTTPIGTFHTNYQMLFVAIFDIITGQKFVKCPSEESVTYPRFILNVY